MKVCRTGIDAAVSAPGFYKELLDHMSDGVYFVDRERRILYWNQGAFRLSGYKAEDMVGRRCQDNTLCHVDASGHELCKEGCPLTACVKDGGAHEAQVFLRHKQGRRVPVSVRVQPIRHDGAIVGAVEIFSDETAHFAALRRTKEMERLAFLDQVTKLPNRRYLDMSLRTALSEYQVHKDSFGVLEIDLDRFKSINDRYGHAIGDRALQEVAKTLGAALRTTDIVGRWGGDEFLAIVRHVNAENLVMLTERCCVLVAQTFIATEGDSVPMSVSVGGALVRADDSPEALIQRADALMYRSKVAGRGRASAG
jgi:diguanylate cyclase (GGDEF)-like protein/PAS domain S-box-containing protein